MPLFKGSRYETVQPFDPDPEGRPLFRGLKPRPIVDQIDLSNQAGDLHGVPPVASDVAEHVLLAFEAEAGARPHFERARLILPPRTDGEDQFVFRASIEGDEE